MTVSVIDDGATALTRRPSRSTTWPRRSTPAWTRRSLEGGTFSSSGSFTDPGADTWTATVNYGDGSGAQALTLSGKTFALTHVYADDGSYTVTVSVFDGSATSTDTATVTVNNVAPTVDAGLDKTILEGGTFSSSGSFTDPGTDTWTATVNYGDGSGAQSLTLSGKTFSLSHVYADDGSYTVTVSVFDGSATSTDTATVTVNNVAPVVSASGAATVDEGSPYSLGVDCTDPGSDTFTGTVAWGDGSSDAIVGAHNTLSHTYAQEDVYTISVTVTDDDGGVGTTTTAVMVNNVAPTVTAGTNDTINEGDTFTQAGSFSDPGADTWSAKVDWDEAGGFVDLAVDQATKTFDLSHKYVQDGTYHVVVKVFDGTEWSSDTTVVTVTANNVAPVVAITSLVTTIDEGSAFWLTGSFTDPGADLWTATVDWGDGSLLAPLALSGKLFADSHAYAQNGLYTVTVTVNDDDTSGTAKVDVTVLNAAPVVDPIADQDATEGTSFSVPVTFSDLGVLDTHSAVVTWGDGSGPQTVDPIVSGDAITHTYDDNGVYDVTVTVTDKDGDSGAASFKVTVANAAPVVDPIADQDATEGTSFSVPVTFSDLGVLDTHSAVVTWGDGSGPQTVDPIVSGDAITHTYDDNGVYDVTVTVTDKDGDSGAASFKVTVANAAPVVDPIADQDATEGTSFSVPVTFSDLGVLDTHSAVVTWGDGSGPQTVDPIVSGDAITHTYDDNGVYDVTVTVTDKDGDSGAASFKVTVANAAPVVDPIADQDATEGTSFSVPVTFSDLGVLDTHSAVVTWGDGSGPADGRPDRERRRHHPHLRRQRRLRRHRDGDRQGRRQRRGQLQGHGRQRAADAHRHG